MEIQEKTWNNVKCVKSLNGGIKFYCPDCIANNIEWCSVCGEPFEVDKNAKDYTYMYLCPDCRESKGGNKSWVLYHK